MGLTSFLLAALLMELTPGPNMVWLAILSATHGVRTALAAVLGIALGLSLLALLAMFGLTALITEFPVVYEVLRWGGVVFMLFLAAEAWFSKPDASRQDVDGGGARWFVRGLIVNLLNPKAAAVYIALIPAALPQEGATLLDILALSAIYVAIATAAHVMIVMFASQLQTLFVREGMARRIRRIMALLLVAVAIWLGFSTAA